MTAQALSHLRILDLTHYIAGPYCTKLMTGFGAEVIKVERPETGDELRRIGPFYQGQPGLDRSIPFLWFNTGKKSITLNLKARKGKEIFEKLVRMVDIVIENFSPGVMDRLGFGYQSLHGIKPDIILTSISNFGQTGPYRNYKATESIMYAMSGLMYVTGDPNREPLAPGPSITQYAAGQTAYLSSLIALVKRETTGRGEHVDVSIQESAMDMGCLILVKHLCFGIVPIRNCDEHMLCPWQVYPCKDGYAVFIGGPPRYWHQVANLVDEPSLAYKKFDRMENRSGKRREIEAKIKPWLNTHTREEIFHAAQSKGLACGHISHLGEVLKSPFHQERAFFKEIEHPIVGKHLYCGAPFRASETPWHGSRASLLGEYNEAIYSGMLGYTKENLSEMAHGGII